MEKEKESLIREIELLIALKDDLQNLISFYKSQEAPAEGLK